VALSVPVSLSPSAVSAFKSCGLAFRFSYVDRLPEPPSIPASRGTLVHAALERLMLHPPPARTPETARAELDRAHDELAEHPEFAGLGLGPDERAAFHAEAAELLDRYFELEDPACVTPIGLEVKLQAEIGGVVVRGIIDRLELDADGELVVTDYKTGSVPSERVEQQRLAGVHFYSALCERVIGRRPARVQLLYLSKPEAIIARPTDRSTSGLERRTAAVYEAVRQACYREDFRPSPGPLCNWCAFKPYCPSFGGDPGQAVELRVAAAEAEAIAAGAPPLFTTSELSPA